jgi:hypothetical protein
MVERLTMPIQTLYAELVDRCSIAAFDADFPPNGNFYKVGVKGRNYWYFKASPDSTGRRAQKYVGPDGPEMQQRVARHGKTKSAYKERRQLIAALRRSGIPVPPEEAGEILDTLSRGGVFRLRACLVGTVAFQAYGGILGIKLPGGAMQTGDIDIAQFRSISVAIAQDDQTEPVLDILRGIDPSFQPVPYAMDARLNMAYKNDSEDRVEVLTPNRGPDRDAPVDLPALQAHGQPLRFLDFLIYDAVPAAVLHGGGVLVNVPRPERYALHKLIISQRRKDGTAKIDKDLQQAEILLDVLAERRKADLRDAWEEMCGRGPKWRLHAADGMASIDKRVREKVIRVIHDDLVPDDPDEEADADPGPDTQQRS